MASSEKDYDVFLNFRGTDVRNNFLSHLYDGLVRNGIHTFKDNEKLWKGEEISPALMRAIKESCVAIVIFSEDYASSPWCLKELAKIMEYKAREELIVFPVFYTVKPGQVRELREGYGPYGNAMATYKSEGRDQETLERWKNALVGASNLAGWDYNNEDQVEFIGGIVKQVSSHVQQKTPLYVAKYPVGIDSRVQEVISLSQKESDDDDVLMIGIWGLGGIGKTAIASAVYNALKKQFEGSCFLGKVRETSDKCNGLVELQEKILSQILYPENLKVSSEGEGCSLIRQRLRHKKVLLVLDDVDKWHQLNMLAGGEDWFGKGSRIFVTSRDKHVLPSHGKNHVYPVETLKDGEARKLFEWHAFQNREKSEIRKEFIDEALRYASGLPLALEVLGSFLCTRNEQAWRSELDKLFDSPEGEINQILKISFHGLGEKEKDIFLDIACFFKGRSTEYIKKVLDGCGFKTNIGIEILVERSLIRNEYGTLQMHDLVQLMGKNIVMQDHPKDLGQCSRFWHLEDVLKILSEERGKNAIEAIVVDLLTPEEINWSLEEIPIEANAFKNMTNLRMLILPEVHISSEGPVRLPSNLGWLKWPKAPLLEFGFGRKELIRLDIQGSHIKQLDDKFKHFRKLKYINFSQCKSLHSVPDFSSIPNLESLDLDGCESLVEVHQSVACHDKLKFLSLQFCFNLSNFPRTLKAKSLQALDLFGCIELEKFSDMPEMMKHLEELDLGWTAIKELPASVENLVSVKIINLRKCKRLPTLPSSVYKLHNLEYLNLGGCSNFVMFPENSEDSTNPNGNLGFRNLFRLDLDGCNLSEVEFLKSHSCFPNLRHIGLSGNKFTHLPTCINKYHNLEHLRVDKCKQLQKIPQLPPNLHVLSAHGCRSLQEFPDLSSLSSNCLVDVSSCRELYCKGASTAPVLSCKELPKMRYVEISLSGREMPEWFLHCKDSSISFMVPGDLSDKFLGIALCIVLGPKERKAYEVECEVNIDGEEFLYQMQPFNSTKSDCVWIHYLPRSELPIKGELPRGDWSHFQVRLWVFKGRLIKWGFHLITEQEEDDLRIVLQHHQPNETNRSSEERDSEEDNWKDTKEEESSSETDDESNKEKLSQPNEINWASKERDSEEDNWIDTEEDKSPSETDYESDKEILFHNLPNTYCAAAESDCRSFESEKKLILGSSYRQQRYEKVRDIYGKLKLNR